MKWVRRRRERRLQTPENLERRRRWEEERQVTDPALHAEADGRLRQTLDRARQVANIAGVVSIRTQPK